VLSAFPNKLTLLALAFPVCLMAADAPQDTAAKTEDTQTDAPVRTRPRVRFGGLTVSAGYSRFSGGYPYNYLEYGRYGYSPYGWGLYDPFWYSPFIHPLMYGAYSIQPSMGQVKLDARRKDASVYLDGAFAGTVETRKHFYLEPGVYELEIREPGQNSYKQRIYVLSGKTLEVRPDLRANREPLP
jgi:hypothetical protein